MRTPLLIYTEYKPFQSIFDFLLCPFECSYPTKRHSNSIESVKETEKQSKKAANLSDFQSSYKSDNSPPEKSHSPSGIFHSTSGAIQNPRLTRFAAMRDAVRRLTRGSPLFRRGRRSLRIPPPPPSGNNTNPRNGFVLFFAVDYFGVALHLKLNVRTKATLSTRKFPLVERDFP